MFVTVQQPEPRHISDDDHAWRRRRDATSAFLGEFVAVPESSPLAELSSLGHWTEQVRNQTYFSALTRVGSIAETSLSGQSHHKLGADSVQFSYQRHDLRLQQRNWLRFLYFTSSVETTADGLLFSCGMSALAAALAVIHKRGFHSMQFSSEPYFESWLLTQRFFPQITLEQTQAEFSNTSDVVVLDTASAVWPVFPKKRGALQLIVIDTSCVAPDSPLVERWICSARRLDVPLLLVRSHVKLDAFGIEPGRLGSVLVVAKSELATTEYMAELRQARSGFGSTFSALSLYPWLGSPDFAELTNSRVTQIRRTTSALAHDLSTRIEARDSIGIRPTEHRIFLLVETGLLHETPAVGSQQGGSPTLSESIATRAQNEGLLVCHAPSFGLDVVTVTDFVNIHDNRHYLRVSGADLPAWMVPTLADVILVEIRNREDHRAPA